MWAFYLQSLPFVDEVAPPSQIPGLNLTQFNEIGGLSDQISINALTGIQPELVGLKPYRIEFFATKFKILTQAKLFITQT